MAQVVLASVADVPGLLQLLVNGGHSAKAGYVAGAFRQTGRAVIADEIFDTMKSAEYDVRESNPFDTIQVFKAPRSLQLLSLDGCGCYGNRCASRFWKYFQNCLVCRKTRRPLFALSRRFIRAMLITRSSISYLAALDSASIIGDL
ncbi:MAG TPA: hypothetical protein VFQ43_08540 [Nitrososphaera sp.]|nr:hypothetical protein [Nitrososphaera sp.]